jgi:hypothetical protein
MVLNTRLKLGNYEIRHRKKDKKSTTVNYFRDSLTFVPWLIRRYRFVLVVFVARVCTCCNTNYVRQCMSYTQHEHFAFVVVEEVAQYRDLYSKKNNKSCCCWQILTENITSLLLFSVGAQINRYGYPYFHRKFASYGAVNGCIRTVSSDLGTVGILADIWAKIESELFWIRTVVNVVLEKRYRTVYNDRLVMNSFDEYGLHKKHHQIWHICKDSYFYVQTCNITLSRTHILTQHNLLHLLIIDGIPFVSCTKRKKSNSLNYYGPMSW